jgi:hypothetical protein
MHIPDDAVQSGRVEPAVCETTTATPTTATTAIPVQNHHFV